MKGSVLFGAGWENDSVEVLWRDAESICGMHGPFKVLCGVNRAAIVKFIIEHCLSPGLGEDMVAQNIISGDPLNNISEFLKGLDAVKSQVRVVLRDRVNSVLPRSTR
jgi:hypothetical protein